MLGSVLLARQGVTLTCLRALHRVQPLHAYAPKHPFQLFYPLFLQQKTDYYAVDMSEQVRATISNSVGQKYACQ